MILPYPADLPAAARARITQAIADADAVFHRATQARVPIEEFRRGFIYFGRAAISDPAAVAAVLQVAEVVVAECGAAPVPQRREEAEHLIDAVIQRSYSHQHSRTIPLEAFGRMIIEALQVEPWWIRFVQACAQAIPPQTAADGADDATASPPTLATVLRCLRVEARWTVEELVEKVGDGVDRTTVQNHLTGKRTPGLKLVRRYEQIFSDALHRAIHLDVRPRPTRRRKTAKTPPKRD